MTNYYENVMKLMGEQVALKLHLCKDKRQHDSPIVINFLSPIEIIIPQLLKQNKNNPTEISAKQM